MENIKKQQIGSGKSLNFMPLHFVCCCLWVAHFVDWFLYLFFLKFILIIFVFFLLSFVVVCKALFCCSAVSGQLSPVVDADFPGLIAGITVTFSNPGCFVPFLLKAFLLLLCLFEILVLRVTLILIFKPWLVYVLMRFWLCFGWRLPFSDVVM